MVIVVTFAVPLRHKHEQRCEWVRASKEKRQRETKRDKGQAATLEPFYCKAPPRQRGPQFSDRPKTMTENGLKNKNGAGGEKGKRRVRQRYTNSKMRKAGESES